MRASMNPTQEPPNARGAPVDGLGRPDILVDTGLTVLPMLETSWP